MLCNFMVTFTLFFRFLNNLPAYTQGHCWYAHREPSWFCGSNANNMVIVSVPFLHQCSLNKIHAIPESKLF